MIPTFMLSNSDLYGYAVVDRLTNPKFPKTDKDLKSIINQMLKIVSSEEFEKYQRDYKYFLKKLRTVIKNKSFDVLLEKKHALKVKKLK